MLARSSPPRFRTLRRWFAVLLLAGLVAPLLLTIPASAQVDDDLNNNGLADQPFASAVDCIESGESRGLASHDSPRFAITCFKSSWSRISYEFPTGTPDGDAPAGEGAVMGFGDGKPDQEVTEPGHTILASVGTGGTADGGVGVGAVYGLAYSSGTNPAAPGSGDPRHDSRAPRTFTSAYFKRMTRFGTGGPGAIYVLAANGQEYQYVQVPDVVPGPNGVSGDPGDGSRTTFLNGQDAAGYQSTMGGLHWQYEDEVARNWVGKVGLGDIEMDPSEQFLIALNLHNKTVYIYDTWAAPTTARWTLSVDANVAACPGGTGNFRPFGIAYGPDGAFFVGYVCSAETTGNNNDLYAGVLRIPSGGTTWTRVVHFPLAPFDAQRSGHPAYPWHPWADATHVPDPESDAVHPRQQPQLAGIEFDEQGGMILSLRSRVGDMSTTIDRNNYAIPMGDILRAAPNGSGGWNAPVATGTEYFRDDDWGILGDGLAAHKESSWGGTAYVPGQHGGGWGGEVAAASITPYTPGSGGVYWYNVSGGQWTAREELQRGSAPFGWGKAAGLGDVELLCAWRAIGNRVWRDSNGNGLQDGGEATISGVRLELLNSLGSQVAALTTGSVANGDDGFRFYVNPFQSYSIRVASSNFAPGGALAGLSYTTINAGDDNLDSDVDGSGLVSVIGGRRGEINLSYDIGISSGANVRISKSATAVAQPGQQVQYTLTYFNDGPSAAAGVSVSDTLPAGMTYVSSSPSASQSGNTLTWSLGTVPAGASGTISINATVTNSVGTSVNNCASITTTSAGDSAADNASCDDTLIRRPNVTISKTGPASIPVGSQIVYTLSYGNNGDGTASSVSVSDTLPAGVTFASATPAPTSSTGGVLTWSLGSLAAGQTGTITVRGTITNSVGASITNCASIATTSLGDNPGDNTGCAGTITQRPEVSIAKTGPATVTAGDTLQYTLSYQNSGTANAAGVTVQDVLPANLTFVSASPAATSQSGQTVNWTVADLAPGASRSIVVTVRASASAANGTVVNNCATVATTSPGDTSANNTGCASTTIQRANVSVTKSSPTTFPVLSGSSVTYYLDYRNDGPAAAVAVTLADVMPSQLRNVTWSCTSGCTGSGSGNISLNLGTLAAGASGRITVTGTAVTTVAREDFVNAVSITTTTPETNTGDNGSTAPSSVWTNDVQIVKAADASNVAGTNFAATLTYRNNGPAGARTVQVVDTLPAGISFVSSVPAPATVSGSTLTWNVGTLTSTQGGAIALTLRSDAGLTNGSTITNTATVSTSDPDRDLANNSSRAPTQVFTEADLVIAKTGAARVNAGETFRVTLSYANNGPSVARSVVVTDTLPPEVIFVEAAPAPSSVAGQLLTWNLGDMAPNTGGQIVVTVRARTDLTAATQTALNVTAIRSTTTDPNPANNQDDHATIIDTPDLAVDKVMPATSFAGVPFTARITVTNAGPSPAPNATLVDTLPAPLTFVSSVPAPASVNGQVVTWNLGTLPPGGSAAIRMTLTSPADADLGTVVNVARASTVGDRDLSNNRDEAPTNLTAIADVSILKDGTPGPILSGQEATYTLRYRNGGPSMARSVSVIDTPPPGFTFVSANPAPTSTDGDLVWAVGDLQPGATGTITLRGTLETSEPTVTLTNTVLIESITDDTDPLNNRSSAETVVQTVDIRITKDMDASAVAGETVVSRLTIENLGPVPGTGIVVTDTLPVDLTFVSADPAPTSVNGRVITWEIDSIADGDLRVITLEARVASTVPHLTVKRNTASVTVAEPDRDLTNNADDAQTEVRGVADVYITKEADPGPLMSGSIVTYTLRYGNNGPSMAPDVVVVDQLPAGFTLERAEPAPATVEGQTLTWRLGQLDANGIGTITVVGRVATTLATETLVNQVTINGGVFDPNEDDNRATAATEVQTVDLQVVKTVDRARANAGEQLTYTLTVRNNGPADARGVVLTDELPVAAILVSSTPAPTRVEGQLLTWELGTLKNGEEVVITVTIQIDPDSVDKLPLTTPGEQV